MTIMCFKMERFKPANKIFRETRRRDEETVHIFKWRIKYEGGKYITFPSK